VADAHNLPPDAAFSVNDLFEELNSYHRQSILAIPMIDLRDRLVGVLVLVNRKKDPRATVNDRDSAARYVVPYRARDVRLARSLAGQAAVAIENTRLYAQIERTLEAVVTTAVSAIDQRDPATAGHSTRVAAMTVRLAEAVDRTERAPFRHVRFTPEQMRELRFAALLHDFGKVAVREEVLMKANKLPPVLWERIDARFDLIRRTIELEHARRTMGDGELAARLDELERMRAIVRDANVPTVQNAAPTPALFDIARSMYERPDGSLAPYLSDEELHFLRIPRGSLDEQERAQVESHAAASYQLLRHIPWTDDLKNLATFAYGHHEKLNGMGYPRRLKAPDIPIQTRIIALADMFDALTETERPYKPALSVDEAFGILQSDAAAGALDGNLVRLARESGAFRDVIEAE